MRFRLRTLMIVLTMGPPLLAAMWLNRESFGEIAPIIIDLIF